MAPAPGSSSPRSRTVGELERRAADRPPVVFVGLDGADWAQLEPLLAAGALPHLARLRAASAWGVLESETPALSPLLWTSMMTGHSPLEHGVLDFSRFRPGSGTREPITSDERRVPAVWNAFAWAGRSADVLGLWATHPAESTGGVVVSDRLFGFLNMEEEPPAGAVAPAEREGWARRELARVRTATGHAELAAYLPGLGEPEYLRHAEAERPYEHPISALRRILIETRLYVALAEARLAEPRPPDLLILYLQGTDSIGHVFAPYAPPRQPGVAEAEFERYRDVAPRYFREVDAHLGRLTAAADRLGAAIVVASDHGFLWGEGRPERLSSFANATAARWHRPEGIWMVRAPGVPPGRAASARLRRVFPTLLALAGLPEASGAEAEPLPGVAASDGEPFDYRRVFEALRERPEVPVAAGDDGTAEAELAELRALGYLGAGESASAPEPVVAAGSTRTAGSFNNEGVILRGEGRAAEARAAFERALEIDPGLASAAWNLSDLLFAAGEVERADALLLRAAGAGLPDATRFVIGRAIGYQRAGQGARSLALLEGAVAALPAERELRLFRGRYRVEAGDCRGALADFEAAIALGPADAAAHASAALAHVCLGERAAAARAARRSLELDADQPRLRALLAEVGGGAR
jgi:tetratricopeptide (TPR) repeat protein